MKIITFVVLFIGVFILTACPVTSSFPLGKEGSVTLDSRLLGTWLVDGEVEGLEAEQITLSKGTAKNTYKVHVDIPGDGFMADTEDFKGWLVELKAEKFLVLQEIIAGIAQEVYYVYHITFDGKSIVTNDITLGVNGRDAVTSISAYQEEVLASMQLENFLANTIYWSKK